MLKQIILLAVLATTVSAETVSVNAGITSNYMARGTSQTLGAPGYSFGVDVSLDSGFYAGGWTSNVDFGDGTDQEIDGWIGYRRQFDGVLFDTSLAIYGYTNDPVPYEMVEVKFAFTETVGKFSFTETVAYSPDYFNILDQSVWGELNIAYNVTDKLTVSTAAGYQYIQGGGSYGCYNVGINYRLNDHVSFDARYFDTNDHGQGKAWENAVSFSMRISF